MDGAEFRRYRTLAQLSIRKTADELHVNPSTISRWESGDSAIPSEAAEEIRRLGAIHAERQNPDETVAYKIGRLTALLEQIALTEPDTYRYQIDQFPAAGIPKLLAKARQHPERLAEHEAELTARMAEIPAEGFPRTLTAEQGANFWLGYYHGKADRHPEDPAPVAD